MYYYSNYSNYADSLSDLYNTKIFQNTESIYGSGIFKDRKLKRELSFTPYIYNLCSADCCFCSEKLERLTVLPNSLNGYEKYEDRLSLILKYLPESVKLSKVQSGARAPKKHQPKRCFC